MQFVYRGRVAWRFEDYVSGDAIVGREGILIKDPKVLKDYILATVDPEFSKKFRRGDIMVGARMFGMSRDHGSLRAMQELGVACIVADSFGRPVFRRCIMYGLPALECPGISGITSRGDEIEVDLTTGEVRNITTGQSLLGIPASEPQLEVIRAGGFIPYLKKKIEEDRAT